MSYLFLSHNKNNPSCFRKGGFLLLGAEDCNNLNFVGLNRNIVKLNTYKYIHE